MNWLSRPSRTRSISICAEWYRSFAPILFVRYRTMTAATRERAVRPVGGAGRRLSCADRVRQESAARSASPLEATERRRHLGVRALLWPSRAKRGAVPITRRQGYRGLAERQDAIPFLNKSMFLAGFPMEAFLTKPTARGISYFMCCAGDGESPERAQNPPHGYFTQISCGID